MRSPFAAKNDGKYNSPRPFLLAVMLDFLALENHFHTRAAEWAGSGDHLTGVLFEDVAHHG